jgi:prephenate dehydrogenase
MTLFKKVTIVGIGLLGGSLGLAIKKKKLAGSVVGFFRHKDKIRQALQMGFLDAGTDDFREAIRESDFIILASPVSDIIKRLRELKKLKTKALLTDIGSTKSEIVKTGRGLNFIGSHPLAGSEKSGMAHARGNLFKGSLCLLTPPHEVSSLSLAKLSRFWKCLGTKTIVLSCDEHDRILAFVSHLPHVAAFALMKTIPNKTLSFAAGGLKDTTRIALSNPKIWNDILLSNKKRVLKSIKAFEETLAEIKKALLENDTSKLTSLLAQAQKKRKQIQQRP